jgi:hypothetical protein
MEALDDEVHGISMLSLLENTHLENSLRRSINATLSSIPLDITTNPHEPQSRQAGT